jgi:hypothetical protein
MRVLYVGGDGLLQQREFNIDADIPQEDLNLIDDGDLDIVRFEGGRYEKVVVESTELEIESEAEDAEDDDDEAPEQHYAIACWDPVPMPS